jgi:hypothetical protein
MKSFATFAIAAATATSASAESCQYALIAPQLHSLAPEIAACTTTSGYNMINPPAMPTPEQQWALCFSCQAFIDKVTPMVWPDCTLPLAGTDQTLTAYFSAVTSPCSL